MIDFFPKTQDELSERSFSGAFISVLSILFICGAGANELRDCMRVETVDQLLPHGMNTGLEMPINLDMQFPDLPCSDFSVGVTDPTGKESLRYSSTLSKWRTTRSGEQIGVPQKLDFEQRVALGVRLGRFMSALADALSRMLQFSLRGGCDRDYSRECPDHWEAIGQGKCRAPSWYFGKCNHVSMFAGYSAADKRDWSSGCGANWPCAQDWVVDPDAAAAEAAARAAFDPDRQLQPIVQV